jgi:hypothetical protein
MPNDPKPDQAGAGQAGKADDSRASFKRTERLRFA